MGLQFLETPTYISGSCGGLRTSSGWAACPRTGPSCGCPVALMAGWWAAFGSAILPLLASNPSLGSFICSCFVHEISVDYCASQPLPNCRGWATYRVAPAKGGAPLSLAQAFPLWYDDTLARWGVVNVAFAESAARAGARGGGGGGGELGPQQIFDAAQYPHNPTCVYAPG